MSPLANAAGNRGIHWLPCRPNQICCRFNRYLTDLVGTPTQICQSVSHSKSIVSPVRTGSGTDRFWRSPGIALVGRDRKPFRYNHTAASATSFNGKYSPGMVITATTTGYLADKRTNFIFSGIRWNIGIHIGVAINYAINWNGQVTGVRSRRDNCPGKSFRICSSSQNRQKLSWNKSASTIEPELLW